MFESVGMCKSCCFERRRGEKTWSFFLVVVYGLHRPSDWKISNVLIEISNCPPEIETIYRNKLVFAVYYTVCAYYAAYPFA